MTLWDGRRAPVTLLGGYLGSGKTTVLNHLLRHPGGRRVAVLVNDVGAVNVDVTLLAAACDDTIELTNGCVCCSLVDGFAVALETLRQRPEPPDQVVVELSGVAEPGRVVPWTRTAGFRLDSVVVLADADQLRARAADPRLADLVAAQLDAADLVLVTKGDLLDSAEADAFDRWLDVRSDAPRLQAVHGHVDPAVLLAPRSRGRDAGDAPPSDTGEGAGSARVGSRTVSVSTTSTRPLEDALAALGGDVLRVKGVVATPDGPHLVQAVGRRRTVVPTDVPADGRLVVIAVDDHAAAEAAADLARRLS